MFNRMLALMFFACFLHQPQEARLNRITVYTPYSTSIVFEYAYEFLYEDGPVKSEDVKSLRSQLLATDRKSVV